MRKTVQWPRATPAIVICLTLAGTAFAQRGLVRAQNDPANLGPSDLTYHDGPVMTGDKRIRLIFYGNTDWAKKAYPIVLDWASGYAQKPTSLSNILTDYPQGEKKFNALAISSSSVSAFYAYTHGAALTDDDVKQIVMDAISQNLLPLDDKAVYFVLTSPDVHETHGNKTFCLNSALGFCGYHANFKFSGKDLKYSFVGDASTQCFFTPCVPPDNRNTSPNGDVGIDAMLSIVSHEAAEAFTNPDVTTGPPFGWFEDGTGKEVADKCDFEYGDTMDGGPGKWNQTWAGRRYLLQMLWNNTIGVCTQSK